MPDNRLPTNESQIDIATKLQAIADAIINKIASAVGVSFDDTNVHYTANNVQTALEECDLTGGGSITGDITIDQANGTSSTEGTTFLNLGNNIASGTDGNSTGIARLYSNTGKYANLYSNPQSANRWIGLPDKTGTVALTSDLQGEAVTITPAQNATVTLNNVKKLGKLITGTCGINYSFTANSWIVVATTTEKPPSNVFYSALNPATGATIGMVQITTTGNIQAYLTTSASGILFSPIYWVN